tara:strand:- start:963 stop:1121 length:159 start_codon:yes stop_codon:yes gene_type:complete
MKHSSMLNPGDSRFSPELLFQQLVRRYRRYQFRRPTPSFSLPDKKADQLHQS